MPMFAILKVLIIYIYNCISEAKTRSNKNIEMRYDKKNFKIQEHVHKHTINIIYKISLIDAKFNSKQINSFQLRPQKISQSFEMYHYYTTSTTSISKHVLSCNNTYFEPTELHQIQGLVKPSPNKKLHHQSSCNKTTRCQTV